MKEKKEWKERKEEKKKKERKKQSQKPISLSLSLRTTTSSLIP